MIDAAALLVGDYVLVKGEHEPGRIIKIDGYGTIGVQWENGKQRWFSNRKGYAAIVAAARKDGNSFKPL